MIFNIVGPEKSGKTTLAAAIRNSQLQNKKGALLIDDNTEVTADNLQAHVEKIVNGPLNSKDVGAVNWKSDPVIVIVGERCAEILAQIEEGLPGFTEKFGPVRKVTVE